MQWTVYMYKKADNETTSKNSTKKYNTSINVLSYIPLLPSTEQHILQSVMRLKPQLC